jgi:sigma-E factor negative regulatory protein RseA
MSDSLNSGEMVSDLMDGRLRDDSFVLAVQALKTQAQAREAWHRYHVVGDVLRSGDLANCADDTGFLSRFQVRLQREAALRPDNADAGALAQVGSEQIVMPATRRVDAANDAGFSWKWAAGFASLLVVVFLGWNRVGDIQGSVAAPQLADARQASPSAVTVDTPTDGQVMIRDPRLDQLLMAHRQSGGASVLQVPSGFLRNATFEVAGPQGLQK